MRAEPMSLFEATCATLAATPSPRVRRPWALLLRSLLDLAGPEAELVSHAERAWASVTFAGSRHEIVLRFRGEAGVDAGEDFVAALPDHEFHIARQIVADATIRGVDHRAVPEEVLEITAEILLVEDC